MPAFIPVLPVEADPPTPEPVVPEFETLEEALADYETFTGSRGHVNVEAIVARVQAREAAEAAVRDAKHAESEVARLAARAAREAREAELAKMAATERKERKLVELYVKRQVPR
jgi:hypothetical protein